MDPFAAMGVAGNIITFIDFGFKILGKAREIQGSVSGATAENESLGPMALRLNGVVEGLQNQHAANNVVDAEFTELAAKCLAVSDELHKLVEATKAQKPYSKASSMKAAWRDWRKKEKKDELKERLGQLRQELNLLLASRTRFDFHDRLEKLVDYGKSSQRELTSLHDNVGALRSAIEARCLDPSTVENIRKVLDLSTRAAVRVRENRILDALMFDVVNERFEDIAEADSATFGWLFGDPSYDYGASYDYGSLEASSESHGDVSETESVANSITSSGDIPRRVPQSSSQASLLSMPTLDSALGNDSDHDSVRSSHSASRADSTHSHDTASLARPSTSIDERPELTNARDTFIEWLQQGSGIFHISGKPGSGKSTLMKYICRHEKTREYLTENKFTEDIEGLVRGILYSILSQAPELIPSVLPQQWDATLVDSHIGLTDHDQIYQAFLALVNNEAYSAHKIAVFVDGLDEFEGSLSDMVHLLVRWTSRQSQDVKICVSSREWIVFEDLFKGLPKIRLHELTRYDISNVVKNMFSNNDRFQQLISCRSPPTLYWECCMLEEDIVEKSAGVFLWVTLILRDIEEGLLSGDTLEQLKAKVDALPTELNDMFWQLFNGIHKTDRREIYAILTVVCQCPKDWPLIRFTFLEEYLRDSDFAMCSVCEPLSDQDVQSRLDKFHRKVYGKLKGLLDICPIIIRFKMRPRFFDSTIKFTHRSVAEFITSDEVQCKMDLHLSGFDVTDALWQTFLAHIRKGPLDLRYLELAGDEYETKFPLRYIHMVYPRFHDEFWQVLQLKGLKMSNTSQSRFWHYLDRLVTTLESYSSDEHMGYETYLHTLVGIGLFSFRLSWSERLALMTAFAGIPPYIYYTAKSHFSSNVDAVTHLAILTHELLHCDGKYARIAGILSILEGYCQRDLLVNQVMPGQAVSCWEFILCCMFGCYGLKYFHPRALPVIAHLILLGADPRVKITLERDAQRLWQSKCYRWVGDQSYTEIFQNSFYALSSNPMIEAYVQDSGTEISLKTLLGRWWLGSFSKPLEDAIDWMMERGGLISAQQRQELRQIFEPTLRPLTTYDAAQRFRKYQAEQESSEGHFAVTRRVWLPVSTDPDEGDDILQPA